jgi:excisionase family DNA binding protein
MTEADEAKPETYVSAATVAKLYDVSTTTVSRAIDSGDLPGVVRLGNGGAVRIPLSAVKAWAKPYKRGER